MLLSPLRLVGWVVPAALIVGGAGLAALARPTDPPAPATRPAPSADPPGTVGPAKPGEPEWAAEFRRVYGLADGQAVKLIPADPFPEVRAAYMRAVPLPQQPTFLIMLGFDGRRFRLRRGYDGAYGWRDEQTRNGIERQLRGRPLREVLADGLNLAPPRLEADPELTAVELYADAVFRDRAPLADVARSLQTELTDKFRLPVTAAARTEEREVLVARGRYTHRPRPGRQNGLVSLAAADLDPERTDGVYSIVTSDPVPLFRALGEVIDRPVIDETDAKSWELVLPPGKESDVAAWVGVREFRYARRSGPDTRPADRAADRDAVLKHVSAQTGVTFTAERRRVEILSLKRADR